MLKGLYLNPNATEKNLKNLKEISDIATKELECKLTHLAIAWTLKYPHVDSGLIGARTVAQLEDSLKSLEILDKLTPELEARINKILDNNPTPRFNFLNWTPKDPARPIAK